MENTWIKSELYPKILGVTRVDLFKKGIDDLLTWANAVFCLKQSYGRGLWTCLSFIKRPYLRPVSFERLSFIHCSAFAPFTHLKGPDYKHTHWTEVAFISAFIQQIPWLLSRNLFFLLNYSWLLTIYLLIYFQLNGL